jgi:hypothetical protein
MKTGGAAAATPVFILHRPASNPNDCKSKNV